MSKIFFKVSVLLVSFAVLMGCDSKGVPKNVDSRSPEAYYYDSKYSIGRNMGVKEGYFYDKIYPFRFRFPSGWNFIGQYDSPGGRRVNLRKHPVGGSLFRKIDAHEIYPDIEICYRFEAVQQNKTHPAILQMSKDIKAFPHDEIPNQEIKKDSKFDFESSMTYSYTYKYGYINPRVEQTWKRIEEVRYIYQDGILIWFKLSDLEENFNNKTLDDIISSLTFSSPPEK